VRSNLKRNHLRLALALVTILSAGAVSAQVLKATVGIDGMI
jgi:hypothetical protein